MVNLSAMKGYVFFEARRGPHPLRPHLCARHRDPAARAAARGMRKSNSRRGCSNLTGLAQFLRKVPTPFRSLVTQVDAGRRTQHAAEHCRESRDVLVTGVERHRGDRLAVRNARQRGEDAGMLSPRDEAHARLLPEEPREGTPADAHARRPRVDIRGCRRRFQKLPAEGCKLAVAGKAGLKVAG